MNGLQLGLASIGGIIGLAALSDAGYSALAIVGSALITAAGGVLVAWITVNGRRTAEPADSDDHPDDPAREVPREK